MNELYNDYHWPGKFEGCQNQRVAEYLYNLSLEGQLEDQYGSVVEPPFRWEGLLIIDKFAAQAVVDEEFNWAYIVTEDENGFFDYTGYDDVNRAKAIFMVNQATWDTEDE